MQIKTLSQLALVLFAFVTGYNTIVAEQSKLGISCANKSTFLDADRKKRREICAGGETKCKGISENLTCTYVKSWFVDYPVPTPHEPYYGPPLSGPGVYREFVECECRPI